MSRPKYEAEKHREQERRIMGKIREVFCYTFREMPLYNVYDYEIRTPNPLIEGDTIRKGLIEIKWRPTLSFGKYPAYKISHKKILYCLAWSHYFEDIPFFLVVEFAGVIYMSTPIKWSEFRSWPVRKGGRYDRGDPQDVEPMVFIPKGKFKPYREV